MHAHVTTVDADRAWLRGYTISAFGRFADVVAEEDLIALADLGLALARRRHWVQRPEAFRVYARRWVEGEVRRTIRRELGWRSRRVTPTEAAAEPSDDGAEARLVVADLLARLPAAQRRLMVAHHVEERSLADLAREVGRHESWVRRNLARARAALRADAGMEAA